MRRRSRRGVTRGASPSATWTSSDARLVFSTQKLDADDPVLAATVPMVRALAARVDELVVLCGRRGPARCRRTSACTSSARRRSCSAARGSRRARPRARGRPDGVVAHMVPLYAVLAAPLVRPRGIPLVLWYTHWKAHAVVRPPRGCARRSFGRRAVVPAALVEGARDRARHRRRRVRVRRAAARRPDCARSSLGRYSPAKGLETILGAARERRRARRGARLGRERRGVQARAAAARRRRREVARSRCAVGGPARFARATCS